MMNHSILKFIQSSNLKGDIDSRIENGMFVIKKMKSDDPREELIFNKEYLKKNGFPNAEVYVGKLSPDGIMKGGYYENPNELTYPFNQFVFLIQGRQKQYTKRAVSNTTTTTPGIFDTLGNLSERLNTGIETLNSYIRPKQSAMKNNNDAKVDVISDSQSKPITEQKQKPISEPITEPEYIFEPIPESISEPISEPITEQKQEPEPEPITESISEPKTNDEKAQEYWIIRVPIEKDEIVPLEKYERMEIMFEQMAKIRMAKKYIGEEQMEEKMDENTIYPLGSIMHKMNKLRMCK